MANRIHDYLCILANYFEPINFEEELFVEDDGSSSTLTEGKERALAEIDAQLVDLQELRSDVQKLSLKKLQEKYT